MNFDRSHTMYERAADHFGLLAQPVRLRVVRSLVDGERSVSGLAERLEESRPGAPIFHRIENESLPGAVARCLSGSTLNT